MKRYQSEIERFLELRIKHEPPFSAEECSQIKSFTLKGALFDMDAFFEDFKNVLIVSFEFSEIRNIASSGLIELEKLFLIKLESCTLDGLDYILNAPNLRKIEITYCQLESIQPLIGRLHKLTEGDFRGNPLTEESYYALKQHQHIRLSSEQDWLLTRKLHAAGVALAIEGWSLHRSCTADWPIQTESESTSVKAEWIEEMLHDGPWTTKSFWDAVKKRRQDERDRTPPPPPKFDTAKHEYTLSTEDALLHVANSSLDARAKKSLSGLIQRMAPLEVEHVDEVFLNELERQMKCTLPIWFRELMPIFSGFSSNRLIFYPQLEPAQVRQEDLILMTYTGILFDRQFFSEFEEYGCLAIASLSGFYVYGCDLNNHHDRTVYLFYNEYIKEWKASSYEAFKDIYAFFDAIERPYSKSEGIE